MGKYMANHGPKCHNKNMTPVDALHYLITDQVVKHIIKWAKVYCVENNIDLLCTINSFGGIISQWSLMVLYNILKNEMHM